MSNGTLSELAIIVRGELHGGDRSFVGVSTDSRTCRAGQLFVALRGPNFDGHDFVERARGTGAVGALVDTPVDCEIPQVVAQDTLAALGRFAGAWRRRFDIPVIAITGSNGKTSVKEMVAAVLGVEHPILATRGNYNNEIGVPITLLRLKRRHRAAVIEMGANHPGEIARLAAIAKPTVGLVTNAAAAHLEGFGSIEGVARAKGELFAGLGDAGTAIINVDDPHATLWREISGARPVVGFGTGEDADYRVENITQEVSAGAPMLRFSLKTPAGSCAVSLSMAGRHNAINAAAAAAAAACAGAGIDAIRSGLAATGPVAGRLVISRSPGGARVIDDTYNANPQSARAAIRFLVEQREPGWLVLGDMGELGKDARELHAQIGKRAREAGVARLYGIGPLSRAAVTAFGAEGRWYEDLETLGAALLRDLTPNVNVLIKASRSMHLERLVSTLAASGIPASMGEEG